MLGLFRDFKSKILAKLQSPCRDLYSILLVTSKWSFCQSHQQIIDELNRKNNGTILIICLIIGNWYTRIQETNLLCQASFCKLQNGISFECF